MVQGDSLEQEWIEIKKDFNFSNILNYYDENIIKMIGKFKIAKNDLYSYAKEIIFSDDEKSSYNKKRIYLAHKLADRETYTSEKYRVMIRSLLHELNHAEQVKSYEEMFDNDEDLFKPLIYKTSLRLINEDVKLYSKAHDAFPTERESNFIGLYESFKTLNDFNPEYVLGKKRSKNMLRLLRNCLIGDYYYDDMIESPFDRLYFEATKESDLLPSYCQFEDCKLTELYNLRDLIYSPELSLYDRLTLGSPISKTVFEEVNNKLENIEDFNEFDSFVRILKKEK